MLNRGGGGGGGGVHPDFFMKFDLEQLTNILGPMTEHLRGFRTPGAHRCPRDSHAHFWFEICPIMPNHLNMLKTQLLGALLEASSLLNSYKKFHQDWTFFRIWPPIFFKGLTQNSTPKLKIIRQFYIDSKYFMKKY